MVSILYIMHMTITVAQLTNEIMIHDQNLMLPPEWHTPALATCIPFADNMMESCMLYEKRGAINIEKAKHDTLTGKYAEICALYVFNKHFGFPSLNLDVEIREGKSKGWECDLPFNDIDKAFPNVHVKNCTKQTYTLFKQLTWTFNIKNENGIGGTDVLFTDGHDHELVALMYVPDLESGKFYIAATAPWGVIKYYLRDPIAKRFKGTKSCLYFDDLIHIKKQQIYGPF